MREPAKSSRVNLGDAALSRRRSAGPGSRSSRTAGFKFLIAQQVGESFKQPFQSGRGHIFVQAGLWKTDLTASMTGACPVPAHYFAWNGAPDPNLTATSVLGLAIFLNVAPGVVEVTMKRKDGGLCQRKITSWGTTATAAQAQVVDGYITVGADFEC